MEGSKGPQTRICRTLGQLLPLASPFTRLTRAGQLEVGKRLGSVVRAKMEQLTGAESQAWRAAVAACAGDGRSELHPLMFGAAVVFADGTQAVSWQKKAIEYGCSLDAVRPAFAHLAIAPTAKQHRAVAMCERALLPT